MAAYTCWQDILNDVVKCMQKSKALLKFSKLKTNEERVDFCLRDDVARSKTQQWLNIMCSSRHKKYWEKASELRAEGNIYFQEKAYEKAIEFYTRSILAAPFPKSEEAASHDEELSLGFGNRSAALFHLHKYQDCLKDLERAIQYDYPHDLRFKLLQRKGQCHVNLGEPTLALQAFVEALELLEEARLDAKKIARQRRDIEATIKSTKELAAETPKATEEEEYELPSVSYNENPTLPSASCALDVRIDKQKGRHIVANRAISAGDTLFVEAPYASVLLPAHYSSHCHHCYASSLAFIPCPECSQVRFCSQACCDDAWDVYHRWECGNLDLLHTVGVAHLGCRIILVTGLSRLREFRDDITKATDASQMPSSSNGGCYGSSYLSVYNLLTHIEDMDVENMIQYAITALLTLMLFDKMNFFASLECQTLRDRLTNCSLASRVGSAPSTPTHKSWSPVHSRLSVSSMDDSDMPSCSTSTELFVGGLVLHHILQSLCNSNAVTQLQVTPQAGSGSSVLNEKQVKVAAGMYPSSSLMNHSCKPGVISSFHKNQLIVRAIDDIADGAEITNCYGPHYRRMPRENRQRVLLEQYFFLCECNACINEDEREQRFHALKCSFCNGALGSPDTTNRTCCLDCGKMQDCTSQLQKVFTAHDLFVQGLQLAAKGNFKDALERLKRCHRTREKVMYRYNRQLAEVQDQLACCYASLGKMLHAVEYLRPTLETTEQIYGPNSIELANEFQKYSDLLINVIAQLAKEGPSFTQELKSLIEEAHTIIDRSMKIVMIHYGSHHASLKELKSKKQQLKIFGP